MSRESLIASLRSLDRGPLAKRRKSEMNMRELLEELARKNALLDQAAAIARREVERQERELARLQSRLAEHREREEAQRLQYRIEAKKNADGKPVLDEDGFPVMTRVPWARRSTMTPREKSEAMERLGPDRYLELPWAIALWVAVLPW
jgi:hypothetical protein